MNFADMIFHHALTRPEKPAIILADRVVTYGMMAQGILAVTDRLRELDLTPGSLVSVAIDSPIRHLIVAAALFRLGHPCLPVTRTSDLSALGLPVALYLEGSSAALVPGLHQVLVEEDWFAAPSRHFDGAPSRAFPSDEAVCYVALSSGTTGRPKAIAFGLDAFHRSLHNYYLSIGQGFWDRMLCLPGLPSNWGFTLAAHALYAGKTLCFADTALDTLHMISVYGADCLVGSTQHLQELVAQQRENPVPCPSLRVIFTGGSLLSQALMTEARGSLCSHIVVQYGSTEAGGTAFAAADRLVETAGATGFVAPWAEVQIVDAEDRMLPPDADGALRIRAPCQGRPYPEAIAAGDTGFRDGWFYPGDLGRLTEAGLLILSGRLSEIINAGGTKLAPELIEDIVRRHPAVADVAALGGIGANGIELVWLAIVARAPVEGQEIIKFCAAKDIPVDRVMTVDSIPRTQTGKIERERLKRSF